MMSLVRAALGTAGLRNSRTLHALAAFAAAFLTSALALADSHGAPHAAKHGGEANLVVPNLGSVKFLGVPGTTLLYAGLVVAALGMAFGLVVYKELENAPVHRSMKEISELIYETCKTYLGTQMRFIFILEAFIAAVIVGYFGFAQ